MKVFMIGGTGLIGSKVAEKLIEKNHQVMSLALEGLPKGAKLPIEMELVFGNYLDIPDNELVSLMRGYDAFVFAAGIDERVEGAPPIYDLYKKYNIDSLKRLLRIAKAVGIKHVAICGSYFAHFARKWPELKLGEYHPYIRSRIDQEIMAFEFANEDFNIAVLELPYIFGTQPGRKPVWTFLIEMIKKMKKATFYPKGSTAMITVNQAAEAIVGALEKNKGANTYPIGFYNLSSKEFMKIVHKAMDYPVKRKIIIVPNFLFKMYSKRIYKKKLKQNIQMGLNMEKFVDLQTKNLFIHPKEASIFLGVKADDIEKAIIESVKLSLVALENKEDLIDMSGK